MDNFLELQHDFLALSVDWLMAPQSYQENHRVLSDFHQILEKLVCVRPVLL